MNNSTEYYFSDWKAITLPIIFGHALFIVFPSFVLDTSVLLVLIFHKELRNPLSVLYKAILTLAIYNEAVTLLIGYGSVVSAIRDCSCSLVIGHHASSAAVHRFAYPLILAETSLLQLLVVKYGKKIATYKIVFTLVIVTAILSLPVPILVGYVSRIRCHELCLGLDARRNISRAGAIIYRVFYAGTWIISMAVIVVCYIGLLVLYKKGALQGRRGESHGVSLKLATLPLVMPFVIHIQILPFFIYSFFGSGAASTFPTHWAQLILHLPYLLSDLSGLVYPILFLYVSSKTRIYWKKALHTFLGFVLELGVACTLWCLYSCSKLSQRRSGRVVPADTEDEQNLVTD